MKGVKLNLCFLHEEFHHEKTLILRLTILPDFSDRSAGFGLVEYK